MCCSRRCAFASTDANTEQSVWLSLPSETFRVRHSWCTMMLSSPRKTSNQSAVWARQPRSETGLRKQAVSGSDSIQRMRVDPCNLTCHPCSAGEFRRVYIANGMRSGCAGITSRTSHAFAAAGISCTLIRIVGFFQTRQPQTQANVLTMSSITYCCSTPISSGLCAPLGVTCNPTSRELSFDFHCAPSTR